MVAVARAGRRHRAARRWCASADALGSGWGDLNQALVKDRALRGRLFAVLGSSLALGDHLVATPSHGTCWRATIALPSADQLRARRSPQSKPKVQRTQRPCWPPLRTLYRDRLLVLAALDMRADRRRTSPCCRSPTVGEHLSDLADAALAAPR